MYGQLGSCTRISICPGFFCITPPCLDRIWPNLHHRDIEHKMFSVWLEFGGQRSGHHVVIGEAAKTPETPRLTHPRDREKYKLIKWKSLCLNTCSTSLSFYNIWMAGPTCTPCSCQEHFTSHMLTMSTKRLLLSLVV